MKYLKTYENLIEPDYDNIDFIKVMDQNNNQINGLTYKFKATRSRLKKISSFYDHDESLKLKILLKEMKMKIHKLFLTNIKLKEEYYKRNPDIKAGEDLGLL